MKVANYWIDYWLYQRLLVSWAGCPNLSCGKRLGASVIPCSILVGLLGRVHGHDADEVGLVEVTEIPEGCHIVDTNWLCEWKGDSHGMVDKVKALMASMRYSQI